jgi:protocatechuate 3,4-dioxygenase, beta subunit
VIIASPGEPGEPLVVSGRVVHEATKAPIADAEVLLYHTDASGCYSAGCKDERNPGARNARLRATLRTDAQGRYEFRTIKPGQYPRSGPPAHIHYELRVGQQPMQAFELVFEGDSRMTMEIRERAARHDFYMLCTPDKAPDGALRCRDADVIVR